MLEAVLEKDITLEVKGKIIVIPKDEIVKVDVVGHLAYYDGLDSPFEVFTGDYGIVQ